MRQQRKISSSFKVESGLPCHRLLLFPLLYDETPFAKQFNDHKLHCMAHTTGTPITYCLADIINKTGMSMTEVRQIKAGNKDALGDGILGLLPGSPLMI